MPSMWCLSLSLICLVMGVLFILFPRGVLEMSRSLNRTLTVLDERVIRYRYLWGVVLFAVSYGLFRLAMLLLLQD